MQHAVMLAPHLKSSFRRCVRDPQTKAVLKTVVFPPQEPQILEDDELDAVKADIGNVLVMASVNDQGIVAPKADKEATEAMRSLVQQQAQSEADARAKAKRKK